MFRGLQSPLRKPACICSKKIHVVEDTVSKLTLIKAKEECEEHFIPLIFMWAGRHVMLSNARLTFYHNRYTIM